MAGCYEGEGEHVTGEELSRDLGKEWEMIRAIRKMPSLFGSYGAIHSY
jgi:hypothetical protein